MAFKIGLTMLDDLARSGLTADDATRLQMVEVSSEVLAKLGLPARPAYEIPYFNLDGSVRSDVRRFRLLDGKLPKYLMTPGSMPSIYLDPIRPWPVIAAETGLPIIVVEGEKVAAAACNIGLNCIALGGVWSFRSKKHNRLSLIDDFYQFNWAGRRVKIVFDSDVMTKPAVLGALHSFSYELSGLGASPCTVILEDVA